MSCGLALVFEDLLAPLEEDRRAHSVAVGAKVADVARLVPSRLRSDLIAAGTLHDIGYAHEDSGLHALDGARFLASQGFSRIVSHLVAHHSASAFEAEERGIDLRAYSPFDVDEDLELLHSVLAWADMTTGPTGMTVTVEDRLDEICARYGPGDVVTRFIGRARPVLLAAGQSPASSIQGVA